MAVRTTVDTLGSLDKTLDRYEGEWAMGFPCRESTSRCGRGERWHTSDTWGGEEEGKEGRTLSQNVLVTCSCCYGVCASHL